MAEPVNIQTYDSFEQMLAESGEYVTQVRGVSMYPMLRYRRDPVLIHPLTRELRRYDIAVYGCGDRYVVHRVLATAGDHYIIRGDNCINREYVPKADVKGIVVGFWRNGRYIDVRNPLYRLYSHIWVALNPLVCAYHKTKSAVSRIFRHFFPKKNQ